MYGVNKDEEIFYADDLNNVVWQNVSGNFISLNQVSMHGNKVCGVTRYGATFCKNNLTGKNWFKLPLKVPLKHVSLFKDKLMGVSYDNDLIKTDNIYDPLSWQFMSNEDKFKQVDINEHGYCGINMDNNIMCNINYNDQGGVKLITGGDKKWKYVDSKNGINGIQDNDDIYFTR